MRRVLTILAVLLLPVVALAQTETVPLQGTVQGTITIPIPAAIVGPPGPPGPAGASITGPMGPQGPKGDPGSGGGGPSSPGCRLTLSSGHPVILADAISSVLYCSPFKPGTITSELAISVGGVPGNAMRDIYLNGSSLCLAAWQGAPCGSTFLGSIVADPVGGQISCTISYGQYRSCGVWNADPAMQVEIILQAGDTSAPDTSCGQGPRNCYVPAQTMGPTHGNPANSLEVFLGRAEQSIEVRYKQIFFLNTSAGAAAYMFGVGWNSMATICGVWGINNIDVPVPGNAVGNTIEAECIVSPFAGVGVAYMLEQGRGNTQAFRNAPNQLLTVRYRG